MICRKVVFSIHIKVSISFTIRNIESNTSSFISRVTNFETFAIEVNSGLR